MGVNSLPKTVTRQRRDCDLNPGPSAPESSTLTTRLPSHPGTLLGRVNHGASLTYCLLYILFYQQISSFVSTGMFHRYSIFTRATVCCCAVLASTSVCVCNADNSRVAEC